MKKVLHFGDFEEVDVSGLPCYESKDKEQSGMPRIGQLSADGSPIRKVKLILTENLVLSSVGYAGNLVLFPHAFRKNVLWLCEVGDNMRGEKAMKPEEFHSLLRLLTKMKAQLSDWTRPDEECDCGGWFAELERICDDSYSKLCRLDYMFSGDNYKRWAETANLPKALSMHGREVKVSYLKKPVKCSDCGAKARLKMTEPDGKSWNWCGTCDLGG